MDPQIRLHLIQVLRQNADLFAYSAADMPEIDPKIVTHKLNVYERVKPVKQKKRNFGLKKTKSMKKFRNCLMLGSLRNVSTPSGWQT